ncbi:MAG: hydrogenase iron-sulfur subunit [Spirochaetales bacterium]|nr:hydrogenase iron-sulfur subunit [Spirochaetales bacterium]
MPEITKTRKAVIFCCENSSLAVNAVKDTRLLEGFEQKVLPCSGKLEVGLILKCLEREHPFILVLACPLDNCKYLKGNMRARKRVDLANNICEEIGIGGGRVRMDYVSSLDAHKVERILKEVREQIQGGLI